MGKRPLNKMIPYGPVTKLKEPSMAKKRETKPPEADEPKAVRTRIIKVFLSDDEIKHLRVAAALTDVGVSEFARAAALEKAAGIVSQGFSS
jgi:hypothetical protein